LNWERGNIKGIVLLLIFREKYFQNMREEWVLKGNVHRGFKKMLRNVGNKESFVQKSGIKEEN